MERSLALKEIPLFKNLSLDPLEAVDQITKEVEYLPGEVRLLRRRPLAKPANRANPAGVQGGAQLT